MNIIIGVDIEIPVAERLLEAQRELDDPLHHLGADPAWTSAEHLRANLLWLPALDPAKLPHLKDELRLLSRTQPELRFGLHGLRFDPEDSRPQRILATITPGDDLLGSLQSRLDSLARHVGVEPRAEWIPAIRLGMLRTPDAPVDLRGILSKYGETDFGSSVARELVVYEVHAGEGRQVRSRVVYRFAFGTGG